MNIWIGDQSAIQGWPRGQSHWVTIIDMNIWISYLSAVQGWPRGQSHENLKPSKWNRPVRFTVNFMERVENSVKGMNSNVELVTLLHKEKTTLIVITAMPVKFTSIYDVRTLSVCLTLRRNCRSIYSYQWISQLGFPLAQTANLFVTKFLDRLGLSISLHRFWRQFFPRVISRAGWWYRCFS